MITFVLNRIRDVSGVSGTGYVAEGVVLANGKVVLSWHGDTPSINIYDNVTDMLSVHGHLGSTEIEYD